LKPPQLTRKEILAGLKRAHDRLTAAERARREASERLQDLPRTDPGHDAALDASIRAAQQLDNELWRFVGAVEFHLGVRR
jgi:hypothetical protein